MGVVALNRETEPRCQACGSATIAQDVWVTLWIGSELKLVEGAPARVCVNCQARYFSPEVEHKLASLVASGAPDWKAARQIAVPVFPYSEIPAFAADVAPSPATEEEKPVVEPAASPSDPDVILY
jgi:YgiT-type zinc finger domain-containing protein